MMMIVIMLMVMVVVILSLIQNLIVVDDYDLIAVEEPQVNFYCID